MGNDWSILEDNGRLTLEKVNSNFIIIEAKHFDKIAENLPLEEEKDVYHKKFIDITDRIERTIRSQGEKSRRIYISWVDTPESDLHCITLVHFLLRPGERTMNVYMRSLSTKKLPGDFGFFCRVAKMYKIDKIQIMVGSLHTYL